MRGKLKRLLRCCLRRTGAWRPHEGPHPFAVTPCTLSGERSVHSFTVPCVTTRTSPPYDVLCHVASLSLVSRATHT